MLLTKSRYLLGLQCPKRLWLTLNSPKEVSESTQFRFDAGKEVEILARKMFDGVLIPTDFKENIEETKKNLGKTLFEAGFLNNNKYVRVDVLKYDGEYDIIEVKSSTSVKNINIYDVSFQKSVVTVPVRNCYVCVIDNSYIKQGDIDVSKLFKLVKVDPVEVIDMSVPKECPSVGIGPHCYNPYACEFVPECWKDVPENNVFDLYRGGKKAWKWFDDGIVLLKDVSDSELNEKQLIQKRCVESGSIHVDKDKIKKFISGLNGPIYFMDFETINPAIPLFDGMRPYQRVPFQWSVHVEDEHFEFLAKSREDFREKFLVNLQKALGDNGSIVTYNKAFEISVLRELADAYPSYSDWVKEIVLRIVDLYDVFKNFWYYNPIQEGSCSIKKVLPAVTGKDYSDLGICDGDSANRLFYEITFGDCDKDYRQKVRNDLVKYCARDTEGLKWVLDGLREIV